MGTSDDPAAAGAPDTSIRPGQRGGSTVRARATSHVPSAGLRAALGLALVCGALATLAASEWASGGLLAHQLRFALLYGLSGAGFAVLATAATSVPLRVALVAAVVVRLVFLPFTPSLSDDVYRYVWDGRVQLAGLNPYRYAPADRRLDAVRYADRGRINHPRLRTIYPPLSELGFAAVAAAHGGVLVVKVLLGLIDLLAAWAVWWLADTKRRRAALVLYLLCPAVILQTWEAAHVEVVAVLLVVLAAGLLRRGRDGWAGVALGLAVAVKLTPLVLVVPALVGGRARPARFLAGLIPALLLPYLPYLLHGGCVRLAVRKRHDLARRLARLRGRARSCCRPAPRAPCARRCSWAARSGSRAACPAARRRRARSPGPPRCSSSACPSSMPGTG